MQVHEPSCSAVLGGWWVRVLQADVLAPETHPKVAQGPRTPQMNVEYHNGPTKAYHGQQQVMWSERLLDHGLLGHNLCSGLHEEQLICETLPFSSARLNFAV
jgi:hypothetical protein